MNNVYQCPKYKKFIFGTYCFTCKDEISNLAHYNFNFDGTPFADILKPFMDKPNDRKTEDRK